MRQIVLDTETTGLDPQQGHRIIEIGCVELLNRQLTGNNFHQYLQPDREIDAGAIEVHGITNEFLADKPRFGEVVEGFLEYVRGAELIIHNASFDVGFLDHELAALNRNGERIADLCTVIDTLSMARKLHPGQKNTLDALCRRYDVDNSRRDLHGALLDAEILADVYLAMTGGQVTLSLESHSTSLPGAGGELAPHTHRKLRRSGQPLPIIEPSEADLAEHRARLEQLDAAVGGVSIWRDRNGA